MKNTINIALVVENISKNMGGEALKIFMYLQKLQEKGISVWLVTHTRVKDELREELSVKQFNKTLFVDDVKLQILLYKISLFFPLRIRELIFGQIIHLISQIESKKIVKELIKSQNIQVVFQPTPNTPFAPSALYDLGVPVVIGPLNGGMTFPPGFQLDSPLISGVLRVGQLLTYILNSWMPGKLKADEIIVANPRTKKLLPKGYQGRVHENIIECGVDLSNFTSSRAKPCDNNIIRFVYTGRLVDWKGVNYLLDAFKKLLSQVDATLHIIGEGEERQKLEEQSKLLELGDSIEFLGWMKHDEIMKHLLNCDVFVMPSLRESCGNSVLEAMVLGLPVIVADWGGPGIIVDSTCGIKIEPSSPVEYVNGLAEAMIKLALSPDMRIGMGQKGRKRIIEQNYDWDSKIDYLIKLFEECVQKPQAASIKE
ncbi:MAG: glycosyltransferase family 4 protein [Cyanobacteria bacterium P01_G01_bin.67]